MQATNLPVVSDLYYKISRIKDDTFRVISLPEGYYFFGYIDFSKIALNQVQVMTDITDSTFKSVGKTPVMSMVDNPALINYLDLHISYSDWANSYLENSAKDEFRRDEEAEQAFKNFTTPKNVKEESDSTFDLD